MTKRIYRYVQSQGSFVEYAKNQNIISCLLRGDNSVSSTELANFLADFDASGVIESKINWLFPEGHALNYLDSQSYDHSHITDFIKKAIVAGGRREALPNDLK